MIINRTLDQIESKIIFLLFYVKYESHTTKIIINFILKKEKLKLRFTNRRFFLLELHIIICSVMKLKF